MLVDGNSQSRHRNRTSVPPRRKVVSRSLAWAGAGGMVAAGVPAATAVGASAAPGAAVSTTITVNLLAKTYGQLSASYLGLSFESSPAVNSGHFDTAGDLPRLLENLGPGVLRFGGASVDRTYSGARPAALARPAPLAPATNWRGIYRGDPRARKPRGRNRHPPGG